MHKPDTVEFAGMEVEVKEPSAFLANLMGALCLLAGCVMFAVIALFVSALFGGCHLLGDPGYQDQSAYYPPSYYQQPAQAYPTPTNPPTAQAGAGGSHDQPPSAVASPPGAVNAPRTVREGAESLATPDFVNSGQASALAGTFPPLPTPPIREPDRRSGFEKATDTGLSILELLGIILPGAGALGLAGRMIWRARRTEKAFQRVAQVIHGPTFHGDPFDPRVAQQQLSPTDMQMIRSRVPARTAGNAETARTAGN